jgi:hypothetical protein
MVCGPVGPHVSLVEGLMAEKNNSDVRPVLNNVKELSMDDLINAA